MPFLLRVDAQPAEAYGVGDNRQDDQDIRPPGPEVSEAAYHQEDDDLDGEGDAVAQEDDTVDRALAACEEEGSLFACGLVQEVLERCGSEIYTSISFFSDRNSRCY